MFPFIDYDKVTSEVKAIVEDRDSKGRNDACPFYEQFYGPSGLLKEFSERVSRIQGAVNKEFTSGNDLYAVKRGDALDLINYAIFYVMFLDRDHAANP